MSAMARRGCARSVTDLLLLSLLLFSTIIVLTTTLLVATPTADVGAKKSKDFEEMGEEGEGRMSFGEGKYASGRGRTVQGRSSPSEEVKHGGRRMIKGQLREEGRTGFAESNREWPSWLERDFKSGEERREEEAERGFAVVAVGLGGGIDQSNLPAYLVKGLAGSAEEVELRGFVGLDIGTSMTGIQSAVDRGSFKGLIPSPAAWSGFTQAGYVFVEGIHAYALSHPHYDHILGLLISGTDDASGAMKPLLGTSFTLETVRSQMFNWLSWPNFGNTGTSPLSNYNYTTLQDDGVSTYALPSTLLSISAFPLNHGGNPVLGIYPSTAFLITTPNSHPTSVTGLSRLLYFGDTGPDSVQQVGILLLEYASTRLVWLLLYDHPPSLSRTYTHAYTQIRT